MGKNAFLWNWEGITDNGIYIKKSHKFYLIMSVWFKMLLNLPVYISVYVKIGVYIKTLQQKHTMQC